MWRRVESADSAILSFSWQARGLLYPGISKGLTREFATRKDHEIEILVWNYHDVDLAVDPAKIDLSVSGLPASAGQALLEHFRIDSNHSNAFTAWKEMGEPQSPSAHQYEQIEAAGQLQLLESPSFIRIEEGAAHFQFALPRQGLSLLRMSWQ
jgi:xylan 1,4-beta-xylosidase